MHGLHPEGKHLACRHRQPDQQTITEPAIAKRLIRTVIMEMMAADMMCMMSLGAITSDVYGQDATWTVQSQTAGCSQHDWTFRTHLSPLERNHLVPLMIYNVCKLYNQSSTKHSFFCVSRFNCYCVVPEGFNSLNHKDNTLIMP